MQLLQGNNNYTNCTIKQIFIFYLSGFREKLYKNAEWRKWRQNVNSITSTAWSYTVFRRRAIKFFNWTGSWMAWADDIRLPWTPTTRSSGTHCAAACWLWKACWRRTATTQTWRNKKYWNFDADFTMPTKFTKLMTTIEPITKVVIVISKRLFSLMAPEGPNYCERNVSQNCHMLLSYLSHPIYINILLKRITCLVKILKQECSV